MEILSPYRHFLSIFCVIWLILGVHSALGGPQGSGLPIVMILSQDDPGLYRKPKATDDPMYETFIGSLSSHMTIVMSPPVLYWLTKRTDEGRAPSYDWAKKLQEEYAVFLTKDEGFLLLIPQEHGNSLAGLGINTDYLSEPLGAAANIKKRLSNPKFSHQPICPEQLDKLFKKHSYSHPVPPKYWYITGHGLDSIDDAKFKWCDATIAELPIYSLVNCLQILNTVNTQSAYLVSCYLAGSNALKLQNILSGAIADERCTSINDLQFPVLIQCSTDIVASPIIDNFPEFFGIITAWNHEEQDSLNALSEQLGKIFMKAEPKMKRLANYPSIRMPNAHTFQPLPLPSTVIISEPLINDQTIEAPTSKETVQVYPADMQRLTLHFPDTELPTIVSRVPGRSHHFIGSITTKATGSIADIIDDFFLMGVMLAGEKEFYCGVSDKAWFIDHLSISNVEEVCGLVVFKGSLKRAMHEAIAVYRASNKSYYRLTSKLPIIDNTVRKELIDEETYIQTVQNIYWQTLPCQDALDEATNKKEKRADHHNLLIEFGKNLSLALFAPDDEEMIQKDLQAVKRNEINTDNYISYVAHTHDEALIDAVVEHGINDDIFTPRDITLLLFKLIDHEYHPLILKQIHKLAEHDDAQILYCVVNAFKYLLDVGLYKHALLLYDDLFVCLKKALSLDNLVRQKDLIADIQKQLMRFVVELVNKNCAQSAVEKVLSLLSNPDLGLQVIGLIMFQTMQNEGFTNDQLEKKKGLLVAIADRLKRAVRLHDAVALYFYEQALVRHYIACIT